MSLPRAGTDLTISYPCGHQETHKRGDLVRDLTRCPLNNCTQTGGIIVVSPQGARFDTST